MKKNNCKNCGAIITTKICPYCNAQTGLKKDLDVQDLPVIECVNPDLHNSSISFLLIIGIIMIFLPIYLFNFGEVHEPGSEKYLPIFILIGIILIIIFIKQLLDRILLKIFGKKITGTVCGYVTNGSQLNGFPIKLIKIKIDTEDGEKYIYYNTKDTKEPYKVNSTIQLKRFNKFFIIEKEEIEYF